MENKKKVFRSRISILLVIFIFVVFIYSAFRLIENDNYQGFYALGGVTLFIIFIFGGMRYIISGNELFLKMWFIPNGSKNITDIVSVRRSYNPLSSPAGSLKRLCICFKTGSFNWLISPVREKEFIESLKAINSNIEVHIPEKTGIWRIWDWDI